MICKTQAQLFDGVAVVLLIFLCFCIGISQITLNFLNFILDQQMKKSHSYIWWLKGWQFL